VLGHPAQAGPIFLDHFALAFASRLAHIHGGMLRDPMPPRLGLSRQKENHAKELLSLCLDCEVPLADIADACNMPIRSFVRAFRQTTGMPPHRWLRWYRVERAKEFLLTSALSLAEITYVCGFADQSHFTRVFRKFVDASPGTWRRIRRM
jgi:transcriptional regulator GlxA family with amidase domain